MYHKILLWSDTDNKMGGGISVEKKKIKGNLASDVSTNSEA